MAAQRWLVARAVLHFVVCTRLARRGARLKRAPGKGWQWTVCKLPLLPSLQHVHMEHVHPR